jgi:hypothetical protein
MGIFGSQNNGNATAFLENRIRGSEYTITEDGTADNITVNLWMTGPYNLKCAIYKESDLSFVGETEERALGPGAAWFTFNFADPKPELDKDVSYILVVWSNATADACVVYYNSLTGTSHMKRDDEVYNGWPNPLVLNENTANIDTSIYCTYTKRITEVPVIGIVSPKIGLPTPHNIGLGT